MPKKLAKAAIKEHLENFAALAKKISKVEETMNAEMQPAIKRFDTATQAIREFYEPRIQKLRDQQSAIEKEVITWLNDQEKDTVVDAGTAEAVRKTETKIGARVIDVKRFLEAAKAKGDEMYECINVLINKAEKLLGKKAVDSISTKPETTLVTTQLRLK
jgi:hypothetical protein